MADRSWFARLKTLVGLMLALYAVCGVFGACLGVVIAKLEPNNDPFALCVPTSDPVRIGMAGGLVEGVLGGAAPGAIFNLSTGKAGGIAGQKATLPGPTGTNSHNLT